MGREPPNDFQFPYEKAYPSQLELMKSIYKCIEERKIGIFESPTGTGKSLSLLCSSLTWLKDEKEKVFKEEEVVVEDNGKEPLWLQKQRAKLRGNKAKDSYVQKLEILEKLKLLEFQAIKKLASQSNLQNKRPKVCLEEDEEDEFLLEEVDLETGGEVSGSTNEGLKRLLQKVDDHLYGHFNQMEDKNLQEPEFVKIFYCSRTHSQLSQLVSEFSKTAFCKGFEMLTVKGLKLTKFTTVTLGSRSNLCTNDRVKSGSKTNFSLNDKCLELQKPGTDTKKRCQYYLPSQRPFLAKFVQLVLAKPNDIEDTLKLGHKTNCCPYYGTRRAVPRAQLICLPYNLLLNSSARKALNIDLRDQVVIFDEAHNLVNSVESMVSVEISLVQMQTMKSALENYILKFNTRLSGTNQMMVKQVRLIVNQLCNYWEIDADKKSTVENEVLDSNSFLHLLKLDLLDLPKLVDYLSQSKLHHKLNGYQQHLELGKEEIAIFTLQQLLVSLSFNDGIGKFLVNFPQRTFKYILLDVASTFQPTVQDARSVVLLGGTLAPQHLIQSLLPDQKARVVTQSFDHIVPKSNILTLTLANDNYKTNFTFNFKTRTDTSMLDKFIHAVLNLLPTVPDGVVLFFSSFAYLDTFYNRIVELRLLERLKQIKPLFMEKAFPNLEKLLGQYQAAIEQNRGGLLLSVMGGKLSEGIDFKDRLGRLVIIVGFPFPNLKSLELQLKLQDVERKFDKNIKDQLYLNLTFQPLNQAVGRVIRHINDYAAVLLVDSRWHSDSTYLNRLPTWLLPSLVKAENPSDVQRKLKDFFQSKS